MKLLGTITFLVMLAVAPALSENKGKVPAVVSAKTVAFVTFATGADAEKLKSKSNEFFSRWKRYQVLEDPSKADLVVLVGPMPAHVSGDAFDAVLAGKPLPEPVNVAGAQSQFAVFNGADVRNSEATSLKPLWSKEISGSDVTPAAKKFKESVVGVTETYAGNTLTFEKCRMLGMRTCE